MRRDGRGEQAEALPKQRLCCFTVNLRKYTIKQQIMTAFVSVSFFILLSLCIVCIVAIVDLGDRTSSAAIESLRNQTESNAATFSSVNAVEISATLQRRAAAANIIAYALSDLYFANDLTFDKNTRYVHLFFCYPKRKTLTFLTSLSHVSA